MLFTLNQICGVIYNVFRRVNSPPANHIVNTTRGSDGTGAMLA